jgi:hypothetical protein
MFASCFPLGKSEGRAKGLAIISAIRSPSHAHEKVCTTRLLLFVYSFAVSTFEQVPRQMLQQVGWLQLENGKVLATKPELVAANKLSGASLVFCFSFQYLLQYWYLVSTFYSFMVSSCRATLSYLLGLASKASRPCALTVDILCNLCWAASSESYCWLHEWRAAAEEAVCAPIQLSRGMYV